MFKKYWIVVLVVSVVVVAGVGGGLYYLNRGKKPVVVQEEGDKLVSEIGKLMLLPEGKPTVATVTDIEKLKSQSFFKNAVNGDKVLVYTNDHKAILYRPSEKKIVDVGVVNIGQEPTANKMVKIALLNGTTKTGLTSLAEKQLKTQVQNLEVVAKENALQKNYAKTLVIDLTNNSADAQALAKVLGASVGQLPQDEKKINGADLMVILGQDQVK